mgnify:CR=1 FL=1
MSNINIFYVDTKSFDFDNKEEVKRYYNLTSSREQSCPARKEYRKIFSGNVEKEIEDINVFLNWVYYKAQNFETKNEFADDRSMMVGDLVQIDNNLYFCSSIGFTKTEWK